MKHPRPLARPEAGAAGSNGSEPRPRVGIIVVTHGCVCGDLVSAAETIVGPLDEVTSVPTDVREPPEAIQRRVALAVKEADLGHGVLVLTDLHGSTPANACMSLLATDRVEVLFGVNLAMLIKLSTCDREHLGPRELAELLRETGRRSIRLGSEMSAPPPGRP